MSKEKFPATHKGSWEDEFQERLSPHKVGRGERQRDDRGAVSPAILRPFAIINWPGEFLPTCGGGGVEILKSHLYKCSLILCYPHSPYLNPCHTQTHTLLKGFHIFRLDV